MNWVSESAKTIAEASDGNPVISTLTIILFYLLFNVFEASMERLFFGERFEHFLDPFFCSVFITYSAYCVYACAKYNSK